MMRGIRGYLMLFFIPLSFAATKERGKEKWLFADMNASRFVHLLTAAAKVNWTLTRFCTPLYEAGHSHRFRTACRHFLPRSFMARFAANEQFVSIPLCGRPLGLQGLVARGKARGTSATTPGMRMPRVFGRGACVVCAEDQGLPAAKFTPLRCVTDFVQLH